MTQIALRCVSQNYGGHAALIDVALTVIAGEHLVLLGPSGCGKTTALRLLAGLEAPSAGHVLLDGEVVSAAGRVLRPPHRRGVAMVFQDLALWPNLTALDNIRLGLAGAGLTAREAKRRGQEALARCGIGELAARRPGQLSGGQQQRVALARAIAARPTFLFLDEPFAGVDLVTKADLLREIAALAAEHQLTIVLVSHDPLEAAGLCLSAEVMADGRIAASGNLTELLRHSALPILKACRDQLHRAHAELISTRTIP